MGCCGQMAAERLKLSDRQLRRLVHRYRDEGSSGLLSRHRGQPSNHLLNPVIVDQALRIIRERYADFGPTLACERLAECHGLTASKETVRRLMTAEGFWVPRKQRPAKLYQLRHRRSCVGELIQNDGSDPRWFEDRGPACTLLVYVEGVASGNGLQSTLSRFQAPVTA